MTNRIVQGLKSPSATLLLGGIMWGLQMFVDAFDLGWPIVTGLIIIFSAWQVWQLGLDKERMENTRPNIVAEPVNVDMEPSFPELLGKKGKRKPAGYKIKRYFLPLLNQVEEGINIEDSAPIAASVDVYDLECRELPELSHGEPFWFNEKARVEREKRENVAHVGHRVGLALLMKKEDKKGLYIFGDRRSYLPGTVDFNFDKKLRVKPSQFYIRVELTVPKNPIDPIWLLVTNKKKADHPTFEILDTPPCEADDE